ncbi:hypothetical protein, partial [Staphylococcus aureus]
MSVATERVENPDLSVDESARIVVAPHTTATLPTRLLVADCSGDPHPSTVYDEPNSVVTPAGDNGWSPAGLTLRVGLGEESAL